MMNKLLNSLDRSCQIPALRIYSSRTLSTTTTTRGRDKNKKDKPTEQQQHGSAAKTSNNLSHLQGILTNMRFKKDKTIFDRLSKFGHSDYFNYATNKQYNRNELKTCESEIWSKLLQYESEQSCIRLPLNGFEEMIQLTEQGRLWKYPIDNEQGLDSEKMVPFEEHVFFDHLLEDFPKNEYIQTFMSFIIAGLARNPWMNVERKHSIINFYKEYFNEKKETYKERGFEI